MDSKTCEIEIVSKKAKKAFLELSVEPIDIRNKVLSLIVDGLKKYKDEIFLENNKDLEDSIKQNVSNALIQRLKFDELKLNELIFGINGLIELEDPLDKIISEVEIDGSIHLKQIAIPIGVIGVIFESRPDALIQIASLCIKSGNSVILKGGSEAKKSNLILFKIIRSALIEANVNEDCVQIIESRADVTELLKQTDFVDLIIPRGSNTFVSYIQENSRIPVLGHSDGVCHVFVDSEADIDKAVKIIIDSKCQYPSACNSVETLLVNEDIAKDFLIKLENKFKKNNVKIIGDDKVQNIIPVDKIASEEDWGKEYGDLIISIKIVGNVDEAINHINSFGSKHTDCIITENQEIAEEFIKKVDSSSVIWNASTRFADGYRYGKGAEVGVSTSKIHARGPVGIEGLLSTKYVLKGNGDVVEDYTKGNKKFKHRKVK
tara:strand:- start:2 stop:1300 length:1299 start_codon:yes stop_codon:yes gene_type:complete